MGTLRACWTAGSGFGPVLLETASSGMELSLRRFMGDFDARSGSAFGRASALGRGAGIGGSDPVTFLSGTVLSGKVLSGKVRFVKGTGRDASTAFGTALGRGTSRSTLPR